MNKRVLVVAAHPDDEVLGAGGTIALHASQGDTVHVLILGEGLTSRQASRQQGLKNVKALKRLRGEAQRASKVLGVKHLECLHFPDNRFDSVNRLDLIKAVEKTVKSLTPSTVYTHHPGDLNIDHRLTYEAVLTAVRPVTPTSVNDLLTFYVPSASEWSHGTFRRFKPNVFLDLSSTLELKVKALACYTGEIRKAPHPRSPEVLRALATVWGASAGFKAAEAFELIRSFRSKHRGG